MAKKGFTTMSEQVYKNGNNKLHRFAEGAVLATVAGVALSACSAETMDKPYTADIENAKITGPSLLELTGEQVQFANNTTTRAVLDQITEMDKRNASVDLNNTDDLGGGYSVRDEFSSYSSADIPADGDISFIRTLTIAPSVAENGSLGLTVTKVLDRSYEAECHYMASSEFTFTNPGLAGLLDDGTLTEEEAKKYLEDSETSLIGVSRESFYEELPDAGETFPPSDEPNEPNRISAEIAGKTVSVDGQSIDGSDDSRQTLVELLTGEVY